jgi:hypothetical protein
VKTLRRGDFHPPPDQVLKVCDEGHLIEHGCTRVELHEHIDIAFVRGFSPRHRPKCPRVPGLVRRESGRQFLCLRSDDFVDSRTGPKTDGTDYRKVPTAGLASRADLDYGLPRIQTKPERKQPDSPSSPIVLGMPLLAHAP